MSRESSLRGITVPFVSYRDIALNGKKVKVRNYAPSWDRLAPHLKIPEGHTGTLTGMVECIGSVPEAGHSGDLNIDCTLFVEIAWDDIRTWHYDFCKHGNQTYRNPCFIDMFMGTYKVTPNFLFFLDDEGKETHCVQDCLKGYTHIRVSHDQDAETSVWIQKLSLK